MKKFLTFLLILFPFVSALAQGEIKVESFKPLPMDMTASSLQWKKIDQNGEVAALIKIETTETGFVFDGGTLGIVHWEQQVGEVWVWVPRGLRKITIKHQKLGVLRDYRFPVEIEAERTYEMVLATVNVNTDDKLEVREQYLLFQVTPPNAMLEVDDLIWELGEDGTAMKFVSFGTYTYRVQASNYYGDAGNVTVDDPNNTVLVKVNLKPKFGLVEVAGTGNLQGASVYIDNTLVGTAPCKSGTLSKGPHNVRIVKELYDPYTETVNVEEGETIKLSPELKPICGSLNVESSPSNAKIYIDNIDMGVTPKLIPELLIGTHILRITKDDYTDYSETINIEKGVQKQVKATLVKSEYYTKGKDFYDKNDFAQAFKLFTEGANAGDAKSQVMLGRMYYNGKGTAQDCEQARRWFQAAIDQNNADAMAWMSDIYVEKKCDQVDYEKALQLIRRSIELGSAYGMNNLGFMYQNGFGVIQDYTEAVKWFRMAAERGDPIGQMDLGGMYHNGKGVTQDYAEAMKWYRMAADQGHAEGFSAIANMYYSGKGVTQNYAEAIKWYKKADEKGLIWTEYYIGLCYERGDNNAQEAAKWYGVAAKNGQLAAQNAFGNCYRNAYGVERNYNEAVKWYRLAADKGYGTAQSNLGWCYQNGYGVSKDYKEAVKWYRLSADQGNMYGIYNLGVCYEHGYGVEKNAQEAFRLYKLSAEKGYSTAQNTMGNCYKNGFGVTKDLNEARKWYQKAADKGDNYAKESLKNLK